MHPTLSTGHRAHALIRKCVDTEFQTHPSLLWGPPCPCSFPGQIPEYGGAPFSKYEACMHLGFSMLETLYWTCTQVDHDVTCCHTMMQRGVPIVTLPSQPPQECVPQAQSQKSWYVQKCQLELLVQHLQPVHCFLLVAEAALAGSAIKLCSVTK